ncbi:DUF4230 domain-containing protein [Xylanibacter muris]|uniref:DUF4230 domain-containing protein n=1 Tax=Xylanibacter muris TaxID=2736290 RepID=A0ABX2ARX4_9BACT|nr:DUF4230 domain-containing protein [Xylanibacter muris]NPD92954.1 DUF4230 domain-containing protein [Xylanibacter muris]
MLKSKTIIYAKIIGFALAAIAVVTAVIMIGNEVRKTDISIVTDKKIGMTPEVIQSIKAIGEWEFLTVTDEEMVDTARKGIFGHDYLAKIYYGTLRLGINMHKVEPGWITSQNDTVRIILPAIELLDNDFIDEASTRVFHETGRWTHTDRETMYNKAYAKMKANGLTKANIKNAENNAENQFRNMMKAMGFKHVEISFSK